MKKEKLILAIETSCDETSAAIYSVEKGLLSNVVASQINIHKKTGGVVPEVASRAHVEQILPVIDEALKKAKVKLEKIDYLAVTHAPGLIGSLLVGVNTAKTLGMILGKPVIPINHLEGHIYANFIREISKKLTKLKANEAKFRFPAVILLVSGGHTSLILMSGHGKYKTLGETLDDAAGEAFDKVAKVLNMEYPGGPNVSRVADIYRKKNKNCHIVTLPHCQGKHSGKNSNEAMKQCNNELRFPRSMLDSGDFSFSFSGLKTSVLYKWQDVTKNIRMNSDKNSGLIRMQFCYEFEEAVVDILATKTILAAKKYKVKTVSICGGVAANKRLREEMGLRIKKLLPTALLNLPPIQFCGDNAAMIGACASYRIKKLKNQEIKKLKNLNFEVMSNKDL